MGTPLPSLAGRRAEEAGVEVSLLRLWRLLWPRKWSLLALVGIVSMLAFLLALSIRPVYRASATLLIEEKTAKLLSIEQVYDLEGDGNNYLQTQLELLRSRALAERVVRELNLVNHPEFDPRQQRRSLFSLAGLRRALIPEGLLPAAPAPQEAALLDEVIRAFMRHVSISPLGKSYLVRVDVDLHDPRLAAQAANALVNGFIEMQLEANMDMSLTASEWMHKRLGELHVNLRNAEDRLQAFREAENLVDLNGIATISASELTQTGERMIDARRQRAEAESLYRQVASIDKQDWERLSSVPAVLANPLIQQFKAEQARARTKVEELSHRYGPRHPDMLAALSELKAVSDNLRVQVEQVVAGIESNYQLALANERSLERAFNTNKAQLQEIARKEFRLRELQREVDANRALYETFMTRLKETAATADLKAANARVVDRAVPPVEPVRPRKGLIVAVAALLSLLAGVALVLLLEALNNTFKSTAQVEAALNLPVFGLLPLLKAQERSGLARMFVRGRDPRFCEAIRTVRTAVMLGGLDHPQPVLVVTSSLPGEGKTTVSANLAFALGQMERVLLIDADLRRPTLARSFEFPVGTPGLANLIAGTARLDECLRAVDGIDVLGAGVVPPNPLELLSSPAFATLLQELKTRYDRIVIDSPPTQAVSDAAVLATHAQALLYVVKAAATAIPVVEKGVGQLLQHAAPVRGVVLNQMDFDKAQQYGYEGYDAYHGYYEPQGSDHA